MAITNSSNVINTLLKSPTGKKLYEEAQKKGVKINFTGSDNSGTLGSYNPNNNTITVKGGSLETMVETLGHELVHATTKENGNSMNEEKTAFKIGEKISQEAGVNYNKHSSSYWDNFVNQAYSGDGLKQDNGIASALSNIGINNNNSTANNSNSFAFTNTGINPCSSCNTNLNSLGNSGSDSLANLSNTNPFDPQSSYDIMTLLMNMLLGLNKDNKNNNFNIFQQNLNSTSSFMG